MNVYCQIHRRKSNWQSELGRTGYKGRRRIMMDNVRKTRKKILLKSSQRHECCGKAKARNNEQETFRFCNIKIKGSTGERRCSKVFSGWVEMNQFGEAARQWAWTIYSICFVVKRSKRKQESRGT